MSNRDIYSELYDTYLQYGWGTLASNYDKNIDMNNETPETILYILGKMRKEHITDLFNNAKKKTNAKEVFLKSFGSTNIKSDYDLSLMGKDAPDIFKYMWKNFYKSACRAIKYKGHCKKSCTEKICTKPHINMTVSLDTNIYLSGYYSATNETMINKYIRKRPGFWIHKNESSTDFGFSPVSQGTKNIEYTFALLKLAKAGDVSNIKRLPHHFSKNLQHFSNANDDIDKLVDFYKKLGGYQILDSDNFEVRYKQMYNSAIPLYDFLYNPIPISEEELCRKICQLNANSIEGAYTNSCVNITVLELQRFINCGRSQDIIYRNNAKLGKGTICNHSDSKWPELEWRPMFLRDDYLISALENIAEFKTHYNPSSDTNKLNNYINYISYIKYILRVSFSIARYNNYETGKYKQDKYAKLYRLCCKIITFKGYNIADIDTNQNELDGYLKSIQITFKLSNRFGLQELSDKLIKEINTLCISAGYTFDIEGLSEKSIGKQTMRESRSKRWTAKKKTLKKK